MNKKGMEMTTGAIIAFVLLGILLLVYLAILRPTASEAGTFFSSEILRAGDTRCLFDTERSGKTLNPTNDIDGDGRLDICDICVCKSLCKNKDDDNDEDGMPDGCENAADTRDRSKISCRFTKTKDGRCCENCPK